MYLTYEKEEEEKITRVELNDVLLCFSSNNCQLMCDCKLRLLNFKY